MRREPTTLSRSLLALALALPTACVETVSCPEGEGISEDGDGCVPLADASAPTDGGDGDAGPCGACPAATPLCREADGECVTCLGEGDCGGDTPLCDTDAGTCVGCLRDADCDDPTAARCEAGACTGCDASLQCAGITGTEVCDTDAATCVQCTTDEADACGGDPCTTAGTCSAYGAAQEACEPCDTDANCADPGHYCVPMRYMGTDRPGGYCLRAVPGCEQPYSVATPVRTTLSGVGGMTFCGINEALATCEAVRALLENQMCPSGADSECPEGGLCRTVGVLTNRCTYQCGFATDCLPSPSPGSTCGDGTPPSAPDFCGG